jgi:hypothetical protein
MARTTALNVPLIQIVLPNNSVTTLVIGIRSVINSALLPLLLMNGCRAQLMENSSELIVQLLKLRVLVHKACQTPCA